MTKKCIVNWCSRRGLETSPRRCNRPAGQGKNGDYCSSHGIDNSKIEPLSVKPTRRKIWSGRGKER